MRRNKEVPLPAAKLRSVAELTRVTVAMERVAAQRYDELADDMEKHRNSDVAALFRRLADEERGHMARIVKWAEGPDETFAEMVDYDWQFSEIFDPDAEELSAGLYLLTPYKALCIAVRNEERAFAFYTEVATQAKDEKVRRRAEELAREELDHVVALRLQRFRAFRAFGKSTRLIPAHQDVRSLDEFKAVAELLERTASEHHLALASAAESMGDAETATVLRGIAEEERASADGFMSSVGSQTKPGVSLRGISAESQSNFVLLRSGLQIVDEAFEALMAVADKATDTSVLKETEGLAEKLIPRLAQIRDRLDQLTDAQGH